jgi:Tfp pilus assembly protein PilO
MKSSDRGILIGLLLLGAFAAFWFLALSPKREEAAKLGTTITELESDIAAQETLVSAGRQAQSDYRRNYSSLVALGKAAPGDGDTPSLLTQLVGISDAAKTRLDLIELGGDVGAPATAAALTTTDSAEEAGGEAAPAEEGAAAATPTPVAVPATEASASSLPLGASVGSAGLAVLPYQMKFSGDFFQIADLFQGIDELIGSQGLKVDVAGRLITVNAFKMTKVNPTDPLEVELSIASYVLPESQGLTAGGTPTTPPASVPEATTVAETAP